MDKLRGRISVEFDYPEPKKSIWDAIDAAEDAIVEALDVGGVYITKIEKDTGA